MQIHEPGLEICLIILPCQPVYGCGVPLQLREREPKDSDADVVEGRGEPFLFLRFAARRIRSCAPAQVTRFPRSVRGARLVGLHFPWPLLRPSIPQPTARPCSPTSQLLRQSLTWIQRFQRQQVEHPNGSLAR
jgi:hypothetical protein